MENKRHRQIARIFTKAVELPAEEREAFLARECGSDRSLLEEVRSLLAHDQVDGTDDLALTEAGKHVAAMICDRLDLAEGYTVSHYKILEKIGEGGMGVVYKAEDTKLRRNVAIKFLHPELTRDKDTQRRFIQEAQAASALQHNNICTIHEIDETKDGKLFISMDWYEGETLKEKIDKGPLSIDGATDITLQVIEGLSRAHEAGMVHRDIKPANIMITSEGVVKILDFGLAKLAGQTKVTKKGTTVGTVAYMSPEQAMGEEVDHRSDIFSLGSVFYEMLTGEQPFKGDHEAAVLYGVINSAPVPLTNIREGVPTGLQKVIDMALAKKRTERYRNANAMANDLKSLRIVPGTVPLKKEHMPRMITRTGVLVIIGILVVGVYLLFGRRDVIDAAIPIAVADFENHTDEAALDGLSGMLITSLEQSRSLAVITRSSMFDMLKNMGEENIERIGEDLGREICRQGNIRVLVVASIRKFDNLYTIDLKAYEMGRPGHLFTAREDGVGQSSIPGIIDRIAEKTREGLNEDSADIELTSEPIAQVTTTNIEAYHLYFQGDFYINHLQSAQAEKVLRQAIELDSTFALAYYRLAYNNWWNQHELEAAAGYINKAIAMIDRMPRREQYLVRALSAALEGGFEAQLPYLREMQEQFPDDKEMLFGIGDATFHTGNSDTARVYFERVLRLDPMFQRALHHIAMIYFNRDQFDDAYAMAARLKDVMNSWDDCFALGLTSLFTGKDEDAIACFQRGFEIATIPSLKEGAVRWLVLAHLAAGNTDQALAVTQSVLEGDYNREHKFWAYRNMIGRVLPYAGRFAEALELADVVIDTAEAWADTSKILAETMDKAYLIYSGGRDEEEMWRVVESTYQYSADAKNIFYWMNLTTLNLLCGRLEEGKRLLDEHDMGWQKPFFHSLEHSVRGDCDSGKTVIDTVVLTERGKANWRFRLALCYAKSGDHRSAIEQLNYVVGRQSLWFTSLPMIPKAHYEMAKSYEALGEMPLAVEHYTTFLDIWKQADQELPDLIHAKERLSALKADG